MNHYGPHMANEEIPERLAYSLPETARLLSVSLSTVKRLIASGSLSVVRIGGQRRVPRSSLYALLEAPQPAQKGAL